MNVDGLSSIIVGFLNSVAGAKAARKIRKYYTKRRLFRSSFNCDDEFHVSLACLSIRPATGNLAVLTGALFLNLGGGNRSFATDNLLKLRQSKHGKRDGR
ncbi:MAG: hypothetical protein QOF42_1222 [Gammaproteobacteria bacterium]|nr:hypothetical protein [Gammaproteobacteria bacterium]